MTLRTELAIIGGGPAGLAAAITAASRGMAVTLIDLGDTPGGATALHPHRYPGTVYRGTEIGPLLWEAAFAAGVMLLPRTAAWGLFEDGALAIATGYGTDAERADTVRADALLLATGATDRYPPFAGDTLPGVITATAALTMVGRWGIQPGKTALVVGSGAGAEAVAAALRDAGMAVTAIEDCMGLRAEAGADGALARATWQDQAFAVINRDRQFRPTLLARATWQDQAFAVDTLVLATAREPMCALAQMVNCPLRYDAAAGGYLPVRDAMMQTPIPSLYVAGDAGGMGDAGAAMAQGQRAAHAIADHLRKPPADVPLPLTIPPGAFRPGATETDADARWMEDDRLILCRCEEVTVAQVRAAIAAGARTPGDVKRRTRVANGPCQGRWCGHNVAQLVAAATGQPIASLAPMTARPPVVPVSLGALADAAPPADGTD